MLRLLKITGDSLSPEFHEGDFVFVSRVPFWFHSPSAGDIIAFRQPGYGLLIKRIQQTTPEVGLYVIGSHPASIDSRTFGPINQKNVIGKVIWHIRKP
ncbi:MAG TPA: S26 family signal peptidase [Anaerolineales bacterium]